MHLSIRALLLVALAMAGAQPAVAQDTTGATARQLSRAVMAGIGVGVDKDEAEGRVDPAFAACLRAIDPLVMEPTYRRILESNFTPAEIAALDAHYGSPMGDLDWRNAVNELRRQHGAPIRDPLVLTDAQQAAIAEFLGTDVAMRLDAVTSDPKGEAMRLLQAEIAKVIGACR